MKQIIQRKANPEILFHDRIMQTHFCRGIPEQIRTVLIRPSRNIFIVLPPAYLPDRFIDPLRTPFGFFQQLSGFFRRKFLPDFWRISGVIFSFPIAFNA